MEVAALHQEQVKIWTPNRKKILIDFLVSFFYKHTFTHKSFTVLSHSLCLIIFPFSFSIGGLDLINKSRKD